MTFYDRLAENGLQPNGGMTTYQHMGWPEKATFGLLKEPASQTSLRCESIDLPPAMACLG